MTDSISLPPAPTKHGNNPDQTPMGPSLDLLLNAVSEWQERDHLPGQFIRSLALCASANPDQASAGFTPLELREAIRKLRPGWMPDASNPDDISKRMRTLFNQAEALIQRKQEHLFQSARDDGHAHLPVLDRSPGGGSGHMTRYLFRLTSLATLPSEDDHPAPISALQPGNVRYRCEDSRTSRALGNLAAGIDIRGWKSWIYLGLGLLGMLSTLALCWLSLMALLVAPKASGTIPMVVTAALVLTMAWRWGFPLFQVLDARILSAPGWLQLMNADEDLLLEWRRPPRHTERRLQLVRYSGSCPVCSGPVRVKRRTWYTSPTNLIGRCEEAPHAHRFTFDHITRCGQRIGH